MGNIVVRKSAVQLHCPSLISQSEYQEKKNFFFLCKLILYYYYFRKKENNW